MTTQIGTDIQKAKSFLDNGELVAIPTETVYGLAANAFDVEAISKIYQVKNRPVFNPLILHVHSINSLEKYVKEVPLVIHRLMERFMPGPLTVLLPKANRVLDMVTAGSHQVAIRIPHNPLTIDLLAHLDYPLAAPSANISGYVSPTNANHVLNSLEGKIPYILDGGECRVGLESTIIGYDKVSQRVLLHRLGGLSISEIENCIDEKIIENIHHSTPETPGQLKSHYATNTPLIIGNIEELALDLNQKKLVVINFKMNKSINAEKQLILSETGSLSEAAKNLFSIMRQADDQKADCILCEYVPNEGLGRAINDRLNRAQHSMK